MTINGDVLEIELDMDIQDVLELKNFVLDRLEYIEEIKVIGEMDSFATSSLFQLLHSIKKSKPSIEIKTISSDLTLINYGLLHWIQHD